MTTVPDSLQHLLLVTLEDPTDPKSWSGIPYSLLTALQNRIPRVTVVAGPQLRPRRTPLTAALRFALGSQRYPLWMTDASLHHYADVVQQAIARHQPDAVLSISSQCLVHLETATPLFMFNDAPWPVFKHAYSPWESSPLPTPQFARQECDASQRCQAVFTGSDWAADEARKIYSIAPGRIHATSLGANWVPAHSTESLLEIAAQRTAVLERAHSAKAIPSADLASAPITAAALITRLAAPASSARAQNLVGPEEAMHHPAAAADSLQLLFLGKDWQRKGGPLAVEVATQLHQRGHSVLLNIVGCTPTIPAESAHVVALHGVLNLDNPSHRARLENLFLDSHFLLVPTQAECYGIAFVESQAFAVPPISRNIHALPSIVLDGITGLLLPHDAPASAYADRIEAFIVNPSAYLKMATAARARYESNLSWQHTADKIISGIRAMASQPRATQPAAKASRNWIPQHLFARTAKAHPHQ